MKLHFSHQYLQQMFTFIKKELKLKVPTYKLSNNKVDPRSLKELAPHELTLWSVWRHEPHQIHMTI